VSVSDDLQAALTKAFECPKMLRETLCVAQSRIGNSTLDEARKPLHMTRLGNLIKVLDVMRPLGVDGKHGSLHTDFCGCEDK
jgi:hypothetical protein